ncbi:MAG: transcriptional repressor [Clostridia bacterium]|nr:transcriptional repressor [Clostridia bacterium]
MPPKSYNTKARRYILEYFLENRDITVSAADILSYLEKKGEKISLTTVYRYLNKLSDEKKVISFSEGTGGKTVYQFVELNNSCDGHLHMQCVKCGKLIHLDCGFMNELKSHIEEKHGFSLNCSGSILYGVCNDCK